MMGDLRPSPPPAGRLRELVEARRRRAAIERCEFCGAEIAPEHGHIVNVPDRALLCVCRPCYLLFTHGGAGSARFRAVPERYIALAPAVVDGDAWSSLQVPVGMAFFFRNSIKERVVAFYPSPAGATESELPLDSWSRIVKGAPVLETMAPDVEALLVRRRGGGPGRAAATGIEGPLDAYLVPIDACYELVGRIRQEWHGFQGGDAAWREIDLFFSRVAARARVPEAG